MATGVELATAWLRIVPSFGGVTDEVSKELSPLQDEADKAGQQSGTKFTNGFRNAVTATAAVMVTAVVAGFKGLYDVGATFDDVSDTIRADTGATGKDLDALVDVAKNVGRQVPAAFSDIGPTVSDLNQRLGLSGKTLETVASQYLEAGRVLNEKVDIQATTAAFTAFGIKGKDVVGGMDDLFRVSQQTGVGMNELAGIVQGTAPALKILGFSFSDSALLAGELDKAGLNSQAVLMSMSKGLITLAKAGEEPQAAFKRVTGEIDGFVKSGDEASALNLASKVFGTKGAQQFVDALKQGTLDVNNLTGATLTSKDTILKAGNDTSDFAEKWQVTMNKAMVAIAPLANTVFNSIGDGLTAVMPGLTALSDWIAKNPAIIEVLVAVILVLTAAFVGITVATWAMNTALLANPITWIVLAIVALIAAIILLLLNWDTVVKFLGDTWAGFVSWITDVMNGFGSWWNEVWNGFIGFVTDVWNGFVGWIKDTWNGFVGWIMDGLKAYANFWIGVWTSIGDFIHTVWNAIVAGIQNAWNTVVNWITTAINAFVTFWSGVWNTVVGAISTAFHGVSSFLGGIWDGIIGGVKSAVNVIIRTINTVIDAINGVVGVAGDAFGLHLRIPHVPMLAQGGTLTQGGWTIVGENGPELLNLPTGAQVNPNYDEVVSDKTIIFENHAPLGQSPAQALDEFANRAEALL